MRIIITGLMLACASIGCRERPSEHLAPTSSALASAAPSTRTAQRFAVDPARSKASFVMDAPVERIHGEAAAAGSGELFLDLHDLSKSTGLVRIDLDRLELYQQRRSDEQGTFGERVKSDRQNEHMKNWLEIGADVPAEVRERNRFVEFKLTRVAAGVTDIMALHGAERKVTATVDGELRLHGRKVGKSAKIEAVFQLDGNRVKAVAIRTLAPVDVHLEEHDVRPREAFGKLAQATLDTLGRKVAKTAPVSFELVATAE